MKKRQRRRAEPVVVVEQAPDKPEMVRQAVLMFYAAATIGLVYVIFNMDELMQLGLGGHISVLVMLFYCVFGSGLMGALAFFLSRRKAWARHVAMGFTFFSLVLSAFEVYEVIGILPGFSVNCILMLVLEVIASVILLLRRSKAWFAWQPGMDTD